MSGVNTGVANGVIHMSKRILRADHVGSLLRTENIKKARKSYYGLNEINRSELTEIEDRSIKNLVKIQENVGLRAVTDGEQRRSFWHYDFMDGLTGMEMVERDPGQGVQFAGVKLRPIFPTITGKIGFPDDHPHLQHFEFLAKHTSVTPKISIPGPSCCHFRTAPADILPEEYKDVELLTQDISLAYKKAVETFYRNGCRYLQMDDIFFAYLCDPKHRQSAIENNLDPDYLIQRYAWMMHEAIKDRPNDMTIAMHMCRGNFRSTHAAEGPYDAVADTVFNQTGVDVFFMEYDTERAGGLEPLSFMAKGKQRVLAGFITTKSGTLEDLDWIRRKYDSASKHIGIDQLGIAPQCGFASTEEGNTITYDDQSRKLELVVKAADSIWGGVES